MNWARTSEDGVFRLSYPDYSVEIELRARRSGPSDYVISLRDSTGDLIESFTDVDLREQNSSVDWYDTLGKTFNTARAQAMGVEKAVGSLLKHIDEEDATIDDDEIPF
jgi:hypothetical protein